VGSQNDALYIINKPPRPSNDYINPNIDVDLVAKVYNDTDAAFIVLACNAHDQLVECVQWIVDHDGECLADHPDILAKFRERLAIAKAPPADAGRTG
jgi:hypothetical protein